MRLRRSSLLLLWALGGLAFLLNGLHSFLGTAKVETVFPSAKESWSSGGFVERGVFHWVDHRTLGEAGLRSLGSWVGSDEWVGETVTDWFPVSGSFRLYVAGYPTKEGCRLYVEFKQGDGAIQTLPYTGNDPHETWMPWEIAVPANVSHARIVAYDQATGGGGWLGFSEPFLSTGSVLSSGLMWLRSITTFALACVLIWFPGLVAQRTAKSSWGRATLLVGTGPLLLAFVGGMVWLAGGVISPLLLGLVLTSVLWFTLGVAVWRQSPEVSSELGTVWVVSVLVAFAGMSKAGFSRGPEGELYRGTISRTLAVGERSDARISYHVVQCVAFHYAPRSAEAHVYFLPYAFFSRGPLAGLAAAPIVLATAGMPSLGHPDATWEPFDETGFAAYRMVSMLLASQVVVACFLVLGAFVDPRWAVIGAGTLALSPFGFHEVFFTWPKWEATTWVLFSFLAAHHRRALVSSLCLVIGYYYHPMAVLFAPWIGLWLLGRIKREGWTWIRASLQFGPPIFLLILPWYLQGGQSSFTDYLFRAQNGSREPLEWLATRWQVFTNTFVPFKLYFFDPNNSGTVSIYGPTREMDRYLFGVWSTYPLAAGIVLWTLTMIAAVRGFRRYRAAWIVLLVGPALFLTVYWSATSSGLMRECAHPWFVSVLGATCFYFSRANGTAARIYQHPALPWIQLPGTWGAAWLTTLVNAPAGTTSLAHFDLVYLLMSSVALVVTAWILSRHTSRHAVAAAKGMGSVA